MTLPLLAIWKVGQPWYMGREILHLDWPASPCPVAPMWGMPTVRKSQGRIFVLYQFIASCPKVPQLGYRHIGGKIYKLDWLSLSHSHHNKNFQHLLCCFCVVLVLCCVSFCAVFFCVVLFCVVLDRVDQMFKWWFWPVAAGRPWVFRYLGRCFAKFM